MLRRTEAEEPRVDRGAIGVSAARDPQRISEATPDVDREAGLLPHGHPKWAIDGVAISARAREVVAELKPIALAVLRFWDHGLRTIVASGRRVIVDASGSYRAS